MLLVNAITEVTTQTQAAPWWGVPVLTGSATLFGALIAYFSARASDNRKSRRDQTQRVMIETRDAGLEYLAAARRVEKLVKQQQSGSRKLPVSEYITESFDAIVELEEQWGKFELYAHDRALETGKELLVAALVLMIPDDAEGTSKGLGDLHRKRIDFMNTLREASGVKKLEHNDIDPIVRKEFVEKNTEMLSKIYERLMDADEEQKK